MRRRAFIAALGGAAAWPLMARGQQSALPVVAYLGLRAATDTDETRYSAFIGGLREAGFVNGQNVIVDNMDITNPEALRAIAADLARRPAAAIFTPLAFAPTIKAATSTIPIVFIDHRPRAYLQASVAERGSRSRL